MKKNQGSNLLGSDLSFSSFCIEFFFTFKSRFRMRKTRRGEEENLGMWASYYASEAVRGMVGIHSFQGVPNKSKVGMGRDSNVQGAKNIDRKIGSDLVIWTTHVSPGF